MAKPITVKYNNVSEDDVINLVLKVAREDVNSNVISSLIDTAIWGGAKTDMQKLEYVFHLLSKLTHFKEDPKGIELVRHAENFILKEGAGDCDDYTTNWTSTILKLGIKEAYIKLVGYANTDTWDHVYVIIKTGKEKYIVLDNVLGTFNKEVSYARVKLYKIQ